MKWLIARIAEPSSHAALAGVIAAVIPLVPEQYRAIAQGLALLFGGTGFIKKG